MNQSPINNFNNQPQSEQQIGNYGNQQNQIILIKCLINQKIVNSNIITKIINISLFSQKTTNNNIISQIIFFNLKIVISKTMI